MSTTNDQTQDDPRITRLTALRRERDEMEASLPKHSVPASMLVRLEDLEEEIAALEAVLTAPEDDRPSA